MVGEDLLLDEAGALDIFPEFELAQAEGFCNGLDTGTDNIFDFFGSWKISEIADVEIRALNELLAEKVPAILFFYNNLAICRGG